MVIKYPIWADLVKEIKTVCLRLKLVQRRIQYVEYSGNLHFSCFGLEIPFLGKFCLKNKNGLFKMKFDMQTNSNMLIALVTFRCLDLNRKYFFGQIWLKISLLVSLLDESRCLG